MGNGFFTYTDEKSDLLEFMMKAQKVYDRICDTVSKEIYINRLLYSLTLDIQYIRNIILSTQSGIDFYNELIKAKEPILIYGAGIRGRELVELFPDVNWVGFIDKNKRGRFSNLDIKACEEYPNLKDSTIVISNLVEYEHIKKELIRRGVVKENIITLEEWNIKSARDQYFETRCIQIDKINNGFVDVGCYDGTNSIEFAQQVRNKNCKIWAFEPDSVQYEICKSNLSHIQFANVFNLALSNHSSKGEEKIVRSLGGRTHVNNSIDSDGVKIDMVSLDELLAQEKIGYIKMDIEGYEKKALYGASNIIKKQKPDLAICVYHKMTDILDIPNLLLEYNPEYKFSLGHYSVTQVETVLYAF